MHSVVTTSGRYPTQLDLSKVIWDSWKPRWPLTYVYEWRCKQCEKVHYSEFYSSEPGDDDFENFDYHCDVCGAYYKKANRIPGANILRQGWYPN